MSASFAKYKKPMSQPLDLQTQDQWREKFAADVVKLAQESAGRDDLLARLHDELNRIGFAFQKIASGGTRAVFGLPFALVLKVRVVELGDSLACTRPRPSPNSAELERSKMFPAFVPRCYGEVYRASEEFDQIIDAIIVEQIVPLHVFTDHLTAALDSTSTANLGICPRSGRVMVLDTGSRWSEGVEESFLRGDHYLMAFPFMKAPRW